MFVNFNEMLNDFKQKSYAVLQFNINNLEWTKYILEACRDLNIPVILGVSVEAEVGHIGETEDNITAISSNATLEDCKILYENTRIDSLAPALGSVHGFYKGGPYLDFETMQIINANLPIPLVLHGGAVFPADKIEEAIRCGISKININTDLQVAWSNAVREKLENDKCVYDPRKIIGAGEKVMKRRISELVELFKTYKINEDFSLQ